jgi:hypothetical protein
VAVGYWLLAVGNICKFDCVDREMQHMPNIENVGIKRKITNPIILDFENK